MKKVTKKAKRKSRINKAPKPKNRLIIPDDLRKRLIRKHKKIQK